MIVPTRYIKAPKLILWYTVYSLKLGLNPLSIDRTPLMTNGIERVNVASTSEHQFSLKKSKKKILSAQTVNIP